MANWADPPAQAARRLGAAVGFILDAGGDVRAPWGLTEEFDASELALLRDALSAALGPDGKPAAVPNALDHPALARSRLMTRRGVQFLAAEPCGGGNALCVVDYRPRAWVPAESRLLSAWARLLGRGPSAVDALTGAYAEETFRDLCEADAADGRPRGLVLLELEAFDQVARDRGADTAGRLLGRLAGTVRSRTRDYDLIGRLAGGRLALWVGASPGGTEAIVRKLNDALRSDFRFPVRVASVTSRPSYADTAAAARSALDAAQRIRPVGRTLTSEQRYQRLILLHRVSLRLFSSHVFDEALGEAGDVILALAGARRLAVQRVEPPGLRVEVLRRGGRRPQDARVEGAAEEEATRGTASWVAGEGAGWLAMPIPSWEKEGAPTGILSLGYEDAEGPDPETRQLLGEVATLLRNAFSAQQRLREQRLLAAVTEQSGDPVILTDLEGRITVWSRGAEALFGWASTEALGKKVHELCVPEDQKESDSRLTKEAIEKGVARADDAVRAAKDGRRVPVATTITLVRDEEGTPFGIVRILRDITRAKELERLKAEFVTLVTHELRTPMTSIWGFAETLQEYGAQIPADESKRYLGIIVREAKRLSRLVTDFLDASRIESGAMSLKTKEVDVRALAQRVSTVFLGQRADVAFKVEVEPDVPAITADEDQLERVLINLCGNAVKYSPQGGTITLGARRRDGILELSVTDQGPGMAAETRSRLFQKFYRANDSVAAKTPGTGLGLYIAKTIVEAHGGAIRVESEPGQGTRMVFELPLTRKTGSTPG